MGTASKRALILNAAAAIVRSEGAVHLTIDAVAAASGVSKGGVLYHFPSKQALLEGMLGLLIEQMTARAADYRAAHQGEANATLLAHIVEEHEQSAEERTMSRAVLAAAASSPELLDRARLLLRDNLDAAARDTSPPELGWLLLLAAEGLRFLEMLQLLPLSRAQCDQVHALMLDMARSHAA